MNQPAKDFIRKKVNQHDIENSKDFETITARISPKHAVMLKLLSKHFSFPISTSFTEIMSKNIYDMVLCLSDEDLKELNLKFQSRIINRAYSSEKQYETCAIDMLLNKEIIQAPPLFDFMEES